MGRTRRSGYALAVAVVLVGLCPYVVVTTAFAPLADSVLSDLHTTQTKVQLAAGLGNAAYAVGAVLAAQLGQRYPQRVLFLCYAPLFVLGSAVSGLATDVVALTLGRCLEGLGAGAMLISALPMLITRYGVRRLAVSAAVVNLGMFGASALGPGLGELVAASAHWRPMFLVVAGCGAASWLLALRGFPASDAPDPDRPFDGLAVCLTVATTALTFVGTSMLTGHRFASWPVLAPLLAGLASLAVLVVVEDRREHALIPVRALLTQLPVTGTMAAMLGGAVFVGAVQLLELQLTEVSHHSPTSSAWLFWPLPVAAAVAAVALGGLFASRLLPLLVVAGFGALVAATALMLALGTGASTWLVLPIGGLLGLGAGATVSPGLFLTGFGLPAAQLGRAFAMVQLLRAMATYAVAPVVVHVAMTASGLPAGVRRASVILLVVAAFGLVWCLAVPLFSGARLRRPDLDGWLDGGQALPSPTTGVHLRPGVDDEDAAPLLGSSGRHRA